MDTFYLSMEHIERRREIALGSLSVEVMNFRIEREDVRYERVLAAIRAYELGIDEWEEEGMPL